MANIRITMATSEVAKGNAAPAYYLWRIKNAAGTEVAGVKTAATPVVEYTSLPAGTYTLESALVDSNNNPVAPVRSDELVVTEPQSGETMQVPSGIASVEYF
jgi:hypothetical protein